MIVFGILSLISIETAKEKNFCVNGDEFLLYFDRSSIFVKCF